MGKSKNRRKKPKKDQRRRVRPRALQPVSSRDLDLLKSLADQLGELPLGECYISNNWREEASMVNVYITRRLPKERLVVVAFLVDFGCLGVKDVFAKKTNEEGLQAMISMGPAPAERCDPALAVKVVRSAVEYAAGLDLKPAREYELAQLIFGDIDPERCDEELVFGKDGKPLYMPGPNDDPEIVIDHLTKKLGEGNFHYIVPVVPF